MTKCSYYHLAATTAGALVTAGPSTLHTINVNTLGSGGVLTIYDGTDTSGAVVAIISTTVVKSNIYDVFCPNGIYLSLATTAADVTIAYQ